MRNIKRQYTELMKRLYLADIPLHAKERFKEHLFRKEITGNPNDPVILLERIIEVRRFLEKSQYLKRKVLQNEYGHDTIEIPEEIKPEGGEHDRNR